MPLSITSRGGVVRYAFFIDSGNDCAWTQYLDAEPVSGSRIKHDGRFYIVNPNPVHTWFGNSEPMVMLTLTTLDEPGG